MMPSTPRGELPSWYLIVREGNALLRLIAAVVLDAELAVAGLVIKEHVAVHVGQEGDRLDVLHRAAKLWREERIGEYLSKTD